MQCRGTSSITEWQYVHQLHGRQGGSCCGPLVTLPLVDGRLDRLEEGLQSEMASRLLWSGLVDALEVNPRMFRLCAVHWMELCYLISNHAHTSRRRDWWGEASLLLRQICAGAGWDPKEIANMMMWQRVRLT